MKIYTGQNLIDTTGPITMTTGKRRITIFECSNDIHIMTDLAKIADLVLLMIDGSYGIEMETFEFLNQLQLHGLPKVIGLLTHLDKFKLNKSLQRTKKVQHSEDRRKKLGSQILHGYVPERPTLKRRKT